MNRIMLAQLYSDLQPADAEPLSVATLAGHLSAMPAGLTVHSTVVNPTVDPGAVRRFVTQVNADRYDMVGLSVPQGTLATALQIISALRRDRTGEPPRVLLGHALPTHLPERFLLADPQAIVFRGWAETALTRYIQTLGQGMASLDTVPGIAFLRDGKVIRTPLPAGTDAASMALPRRMGAAGSYFRRVESSRGCHFGRCTFCTRPPGSTNAWSRLDVDRITADLMGLRDFGVSRFTFTDEDFFGRAPEETALLADTIRDVDRFNFSISVRADNLVPHHADAGLLQRREWLLRNLQDAGLSNIFVGVESLSDSQLRRYGKGSTANQAIYAIDSLRRAGFDIEIGLIPFDPLVTLAELHESATALNATGIWSAVGSLFNRMRIQADTPMSRNAKVQPYMLSLDENMMSMEWRFADPDVAWVFDTCYTWWKPIDYVYRLLRNVDRTRTRSANQLIAAADAVSAIRRISVDVLLLIIDMVVKDTREEITAGLVEARRRVLRVLARAADPFRHPVDDDGPWPDSWSQLVEQLDVLGV